MKRQTLYKMLTSSPIISWSVQILLLQYLTLNCLSFAICTFLIVDSFEQLKSMSVFNIKIEEYKINL